MTELDERVDALQRALTAATGIDRTGDPRAWMHLKTAMQVLVYASEPVDPPHLLRVLTDTGYRATLAGKCPRALREKVVKWSGFSSFEASVPAHLPALRAWADRHACAPMRDPVETTTLHERLYARRAGRRP